jgi:endonuclease G
LTSSHLTRRAARPSRLRRDSQLTRPSASDSDYRRSGYTRGHLAPAADFAFSDQAIRSTFVLSNAVPQTRHLNCGRWAQIESSVRYPAEVAESVVVYTGPIVESPNPATIGEGMVAVPTHLFKVILLNQDNTRVLFAVIAPNTDTPLPSMQALAVSVEEVERRTGLDFFSQLPGDEERRLESRLLPLPRLQ